MSADAGSVFDVYRQRVERPLYRLFREYGPGRLKWMTVGMIANVISRGASLLPPLVLGVAIDSVLTGDSPYTLPLVPAGWLPTADAEQFWFSVTLIVASFIITGIFTWVYGVVHESEALVQPTRTRSVLVTRPTTSHTG